MTRSLLVFLSLTYIVSWTLFIAAASLSGGTGLDANPIFLLGVFAPSLVALGLTARAAGREGVLALLGRITEVPDHARWYVFAVTYFAAIKLAAAVAHRLFAGAWPAFGETPVYVMAMAIVISTPVQAGEEIGWRGYALPRLAAHLGLPAASVVLGVVWACWHLPLFFMRGADTFGQSFPMYLLSVTALSVAMAWLYWRTNASLFMVMLMHAAVNNTKDAVPSAVVGATNAFALSPSLIAWLTTAMLWACAGYFLLRMRGAPLPKAAREVGGAKT